MSSQVKKDKTPEIFFSYFRLWIYSCFTTQTIETLLLMQVAHVILQKVKFIMQNSCYKLKVVVHQYSQRIVEHIIKGFTV